MLKVWFSGRNLTVERRMVMKLALVLAISLLAGCTKKAAVTEAAVSQVVETTSGHVEPVESVEPAAETK